MSQILCRLCHQVGTLPVRRHLLHSPRHSFQAQSGAERPLCCRRVRQDRFVHAAAPSAAETLGQQEAGPGTASQPQQSPAEPPLVTALDIRVGRIVKIDDHPDADSLYVESIDVGEDEPRTIVSGLVQYVPKDALLDQLVVVLCNLKPRNMRGIKSNGMLLCASNDAHDCVEPLNPPEAAAVGERVFFEADAAPQPQPESPNKVQKKKIWEAVQPDLKTDNERRAGYKGMLMQTTAGSITSASLAAASIS